MMSTAGVIIVGGSAEGERRMKTDNIGINRDANRVAPQDRKVCDRKRKHELRKHNGQ